MAKEKQTEMDLEQGIQMRGFSDNEPRGQLRLDRAVKLPGLTEHRRIKPKIPKYGILDLKYSRCCINRVPSWLRTVKPDAYTPRMVKIGPLHHSKNPDAPKLPQNDYRYKTMDAQKKTFRKVITKTGSRLRIITKGSPAEDQTIIEDFKTIIKLNEEAIRKSYEEPTEWMKSDEFVEMILDDSVFILALFLEIGSVVKVKPGDFLHEKTNLKSTILEDLCLLENQLPYALLETLFKALSYAFDITEKFYNITLRVFEFERYHDDIVSIKHFTDLYRSVRLETHDLSELQWGTIKSLDSAEKLVCKRVDFATFDEKNDLSLEIELQGRDLKMHCFKAEDSTERVMRNIMALEQCHYHRFPYVCNYMSFLNFLISTAKDVDVLVDKGVVKNSLGSQKSVVNMVKDMCKGIPNAESHYYHVAESLKDLNTNCVKLHFNKSMASLKRVYFKDVWTGTATVGGVLILILTFIATVASVIQVMQNKNNPTASPPHPPPPAKH